MTIYRRIMVLAACVPLVTACAAEPPSEPAIKAPFALDLSTQVGSPDGPDAFAGLTWVGPTVDGGVLVLEEQTNRVRVFDPDGRQRLEFGGTGDGPGEASTSHVARELPDGSFVVGSAYPPLLQRFGSDGVYLESVDPWQAGAVPPEGTVGAFGIWQAVSPDTAYLQVGPIPAPGSDGAEAFLLLLTRHEGTWKTERILEWPNLLNSGLTGPPILSPVPSWAGEAGAVVYFTLASESEVERREIGTGSVRVLSRAMRPDPVTEEIQAQALDALRAHLTEDFPMQRVGQLLENSTFAPTVPMIDRLIHDPGTGRLWVSRPTVSTIAARRPASDWDVFDDDGEYTGSVTVPPRFRLTEVQDGQLYGVWMDQLDVEYARVYSMRDDSPREGVIHLT